MGLVDTRSIQNGLFAGGPRGAIRWTPSSIAGGWRPCIHRLVNETRWLGRFVILINWAWIFFSRELVFVINPSPARRVSVAAVAAGRRLTVDRMVGQSQDLFHSSQNSKFF